MQSFPTPGSKYRVSTGGCGAYGDEYPLAWGRDGRELVYAAGDNVTMMAVPIQTTPRFQAGVPQPLFKLPKNYMGVGIAMTADARRFLVAVSTNEGNPTTLSVVLNWAEGLKPR